MRLWPASSYMAITTTSREARRRRPETAPLNASLKYDSLFAGIRYKLLSFLPANSALSTAGKSCPKGTSVKRSGSLAAIGFAFSMLASAADAGSLNAVSYQPMPAATALQVRPLDDSDHNLLLKADFERELRAKGYAISKDAKLVFTFETRDTAGAWTGEGPNPFVELSNNPDQTGIEAPRVRFNLFNTQRGGILNPDRTEPTRMVTPSSFRIDVTIDSMTDGKRLWHGWGSIDIGADDPRERTRAMIPIMVEAIGKTIRQQSFQVP